MRQAHASTFCQLPQGSAPTSPERNRGRIVQTLEATAPVCDAWRYRVWQLGATVTQNNLPRSCCAPVELRALDSRPTRPHRARRHWPSAARSARRAVQTAGGSRGRRPARPRLAGPESSSSSPTERSWSRSSRLRASASAACGRQHRLPRCVTRCVADRTCPRARPAVRLLAEHDLEAVRNELLVVSCACSTSSCTSRNCCGPPQPACHRRRTATRQAAAGARSPAGGRPVPGFRGQVLQPVPVGVGI